MTKTSALSLAAAISQAVAAQLDAAFVQKEVETRVGKLVIEAVDSALRTYSDTGKLITAAVMDALRVDHLDLPSYGSVVASILKAQIEGNVSELVAGRLSKDMAELLSLAPKQIKLSQIAEEMCEQHKEDGDYGPVITVIVEDSGHGFTMIYLDERDVHRGSRAKYECRHSLHLNREGEIIGATVDNRDTTTKQHLGRSYGLAQKLRAYVACGTKIILDEDAVVTCVGDY